MTGTSTRQCVRLHRRTGAAVSAAAPPLADKLRNTLGAPSRYRVLRLRQPRYAVTGRLHNFAISRWTTSRLERSILEVMFRRTFGALSGVILAYVSAGSVLSI